MSSAEEDVPQTVESTNPLAEFYARNKTRKSIHANTEYLERFVEGVGLAGQMASDPTKYMYKKQETAERFAEMFPLVEPFMLSVPIWIKGGMTLLQYAVHCGVPELVARVMYLSQHKDDWNCMEQRAMKNTLLSRPDSNGDTLMHTLFRLANKSPQTALETLVTFFFDPVYFSLFTDSLLSRLETCNNAGQTPIQLTTNEAFVSAVGELLPDKALSLRTHSLFSAAAERFGMASENEEQVISKAEEAEIDASPALCQFVTSKASQNLVPGVPSSLLFSSTG